MRTVIGVDAGGTSTRAVCLDATGECVGLGRSGPGNPLSSPGVAVSSLFAAISDAAATAGSVPDLVVVTMAGGLAPSTRPPVVEGLRALGVGAPIEFASDVLSAFCSASAAENGRILLAGTGAVAASVRGGELARMLDGYGWLLGDRGSGFWIGREAVLAAIADLDGTGPATALTEQVLRAVSATGGVLEDGHGPEAPVGHGVRAVHAAGDAVDNGRRFDVTELVAHVYQHMRPVELSQFAPLVLGTPGDAVAGDILERAADHLLATLASVGPAGGGPTVLAGGILSQPGPLSDRVRSAVPKWVAVGDGLVGAGSLALRRAGVELTTMVFSKIATSLGELAVPAEGGYSRNP